MAPFFIDFEAFQHGPNGKFKLKELCILDVERPLLPLYYTFASRKSWDRLTNGQRRTYEYQTRELHHLEWSEGHARYCSGCIMHHIKKTFSNSANSIFYVMDQVDGAKINYLKEEFPELNLINYTMVFNNLPIIPHNIKCFHREHGDHCAYLKCMRLYHHYICACLL